MEIRAEWERVVQTKPYESLRIRLGVTENVVLPEEGAAGVPAKAASVVAKLAAEHCRVYFEQLARIGEALVAEQLAKLTPTPAPGVPEGEGSLYPTSPQPPRARR